MLTILLVITMFILFLGILVVITLHHKKISNIEAQLFSRNNKKNRSNENEKQYQNELTNIKKEIRQIQQQINSGSENKNRYPTPENKTGNVNHSPKKEETPPIKEEKKITQYFEIPDLPEGFSFNHASQKPDGRKYYYISFGANDNKGQVFFSEGRDLDKSAIAQMDDILKPACKILNEDMKNPSIIQTVEPGEVEKQEDYWRITKKITVKFA